jgi:hypothetical protein
LNIWLASAKGMVSIMDSETGDILSLLSWEEWGLNVEESAGPDESLTSTPVLTQSESTKKLSMIGVHRHDTYNKAFDELQASKVHKNMPNTTKKHLDDFIWAAFSSDGPTVSLSSEVALFLYLADSAHL